MKRNIFQFCLLIGCAGGCYCQSVIVTDTLEWNVGTRLGFELKGDVPATMTDWSITDDTISGSFKGSLDELSLKYPRNQKALDMSEKLLEANFLGCSICIGNIELTLDKKNLEAISGTIAFDGRRENLKFNVLQDSNRIILKTGINRRDFEMDFNHLGVLGLLMDFCIKDTISMSSSFILPVEWTKN